MNVFWVVTKISGVVDLVLKELKSQDLLVIEGTIEVGLPTMPAILLSIKFLG